MFPPKCCLTEIPIKDIIAALDKKQKELYKSKTAEYSLKTENRWYCPEAKCAKWIPPSRLRLQTLRAQCPYCDTRICGHCRGVAHAAGVECPQDFGLEATLEEAERQGWRRCYKCRALVELTAGCRHITCKCSAQFCYTCGARWRTCSCTEVDQQRRQIEIAERRIASNARSREEEEEIARAIAAIEEMERREAEERARETEELERREALRRAIQASERRRMEHLERLEAEKRRREEEEAARRREQAIRSCTTESINHLQGALLEIQRFQQSSLILRHSSESTALNEVMKKQEAVEKAKLGSLQTKLDSNSTLRSKSLQSVHEAAVAKLISENEAEEDDTFMSLQEYLREKPNREARMKSALDRLRHRQKDEMDKLTEVHDAKIKLLVANVSMERNALQKGYTLQSADSVSRNNEAMVLLNQMVMAEREWFELVAERRRVLMEELEQQLWSRSGVEKVAAVCDNQEWPLDSSSTTRGQPQIKGKFLGSPSIERLATTALCQEVVGA
jgi:hypothetical protein